MNVHGDRTPEPVSRPAEPAPALGALDHLALDLHREINARRASLEDPEMLRRLRSL